MFRSAFSIQSTLSDLYKFSYSPEKLVGSPPETHSENERVIKYFSAYLGRPATIDDLCRPALLSYRTWRVSEGQRHKRVTLKAAKRELSLATANKDIRILYALWQWAWDSDFAAVPPKKIKKLRELKHCVEAYCVDRLGRVLQSCFDEKGTIHGVPAGLWWYTHLDAIYWTGARRKAMLRVRYSDWELGPRILDLRAATQKQGAEQRFELPTETAAAIEQMRDPKRDLIWPWRKTHGCYYDHLHRILKRSGISKIPKKPIHGLRASHATYVYAKYGLEAARKALGHSHTNTTIGYIDESILPGMTPTDALPTPTRPTRQTET